MDIFFTYENNNIMNCPRCCSSNLRVRFHDELIFIVTKPIRMLPFIKRRTAIKRVCRHFGVICRNCYYHYMLPTDDNRVYDAINRIDREVAQEFDPHEVKLMFQYIGY